MKESTKAEYNDRAQIIISGYPKSGNTWLSRLLGDVLNSPIRAGKDRLSLADGGYSKPGKYVIRQLHIVKQPDEGKVIFLMRDPRDVSISVKHYWKRETLAETIMIMGKGEWPIPHGGGWVKFNDFWTVNGYQVSTTYEKLSEDTEKELWRIIRGFFGLWGHVSYDDVVGAVERESFDNRRDMIENHGQNMPYGRKIQLINMRKGIVGDWRNHYKREHAILAEQYFGDAMRKYGYDAPEGWWRNIDKE